MPLDYHEVTGDLFSTASDVSLAHCVSVDLSMSKGIATLFRSKFGQVDKLKKQNVPVGGCAYITVEDRPIFYLITKEKYYQKPTLRSLESSIRTMRDLCIAQNVRQLAMPRIGCGLDKLDWNDVSQSIRNIFANDDIQITIYSL